MWEKANPSFLDLTRAMKSVDYKQVDADVHQLKGSSSRYHFFSLVKGSTCNCKDKRNEPVCFNLSVSCCIEKLYSQYIYASNVVYVFVTKMLKEQCLLRHAALVQHG